jgi:hypothetical protein
VQTKGTGKGDLMPLEGLVARERGGSTLFTCGAVTTQEASCATDSLSWPDVANMTLGFKAFPVKDVKSEFLDPSCVGGFVPGTGGFVTSPRKSGGYVTKPGICHESCYSNAHL